MKVKEVLKAFEKIIEKENLRATTKQKYVYSFNEFLTNIYSREADTKVIKSNELLNELQKIKDKSKASSITNSILRIKKYDNEIDFPKEKELKEIVSLKSTNKKMGLEDKKLDTVMRKINVIRDKKLKLAYRLALSSGLRISEVSNLNRDNIKFTDSDITIFVKDGKGGKDGAVKCLKDPYLEKELKKHIESLEGEEVFHSKQHMINKAVRLGFECHDLRRAFSKRLYEERKPIVGREQAKIEVQQALRHTRIETTNIYLNSKIDI